MPLFTPKPPHQHAGLATRRGDAMPSRRTGLADRTAITPPPAAGTAASTLLKRYRPLQTRATGGFGSVEICLDARLQRRVAIKRIPLASPRNLTARETVASALAEARTASMLQHPNIVQVIDFTYDSAYAYLVMEYVDGMSLEEFLEQVDGNSLTYDEAACIADALVQALAYAHDNGVLHLDIKPANVLIDHSGHVKLADFGMATLASAAGFGGARGGTIGYMPPEQLRGDEVDERSDVFSLGTVLYEALCAATPFRAGTPTDSLANIERGVLYPSDLLPDIPPATEDALLHALEPEPAGRAGSVQEFGDAFCAQLGNAREGRRSLARIIARLTSDEADGEYGEGGTGERGVWELDPAEGYLGSRDPRARRIAMAGASMLSTGALAWALLGALDVEGVVPRLIVAAGVACAAAIAPQIGSALALAGAVMIISAATPLVAGLPVIVVLFALAAGWWLVWGRLQPGASASFTVGVGLAALCADAVLPAPVTVALTAFMLPAPSAAATIAFCLPFARLLICALANGGALPLDAALGALDAGFLVACALMAGTAFALSRLLDAAWTRSLDGRGTGILAAAYPLPALASALACCLVHPMEIAQLLTLELPGAVGAGILSSIIVWICIYLLGYKREVIEGDRS